MADRPNIVVLLCDQMRRQATSRAGDPNVDTPNLTRLANEGTRCSNANATTPICVPARFTIVTGEHAHTRHAHHGWRMSPSERTFAHELSEAGYRTAYIGKWHLADVGTKRPVPASLQGGFDYWRGFELRNAPFDTVYYEDDDPTPRPIEGYQTDGLFDLAFEFLDDHGDDDRPFCLVVSVEPPHPPFTVPAPYYEDVADRTLELRPNVPYCDDVLPDSYSGWGDKETASEDLFTDHEYFGDRLLDDLRSYYAMIENLDDNVGRFLDELETRGLREESAILFTSDHGELFGSHGYTGKQHPYEESVGVPFVLSYPDGGIDEGRTLDVPTCLEDIYPTLLGLAGFETPEKPGVDLTSLLRGDRTALGRPGVLLEFVREVRPGLPYHDETWRGFRTEQYKYLVKGDPVEGGEPWMLFDLEADQYERNNLVDDPEYASVARELHGHLRDALIRYRDDYALRSSFGHDQVNRRHE